jgi:hypothetical protein
MKTAPIVDLHAGRGRHRLQLPDAASWLQTGVGMVRPSTRLIEEAVTMVTSSAIDTFLRAIESAAIPSCDAWSEDATLDATVPNWRMRLTGPDAIRAEYVRWFADPARFEDLRRRPLGDGTGEVVEYTLAWQENGVPHTGHHMHLLTVRDGKIVADTVMCGGRWPASLMAEMEAADVGA